jgi:hypothetical protein
MKRVFLVWLAVWILPAAQDAKTGYTAIPPTHKRQSGQHFRPSSQALTVSDVALGAESFNPSRNEKLRITYHLSRDAKVSIRVFDPDQVLVRTLVLKVWRKAGKNQEIWNGRDLDGAVVPNEAYFFTIEAEDSTGKNVMYDPVTFSGGEFGDITRGQMDRETGTLTYKLSQPSRVLLRAGMSTGLLLKTIVDWEPRSSGTITEYWNGRDEDGFFDVPSMKGTTMVLAYITMPDCSVITIGNNKYSFRKYKEGLAKKRPMKEPRPMANARKISPHFLKSRLTDRAFKLNILFPDYDKSGIPASVVPVENGRALLRLSVPDADKEVLAGQQFEIMVHIDTAFLFEEERGYLPFNAPLEVKSLPPGQHILTINIITFGDQIGVASRKINVVR